jgi:uncharacterized protein YqgC (DUF456 family)
METLFIIIGGLFILAGLIGSFLPVLPGPPLSYIGLLILHFSTGFPFSTTFLVIWAIIVGAVMVLDNIIPTMGTKRWGGTTYGVTGSMAGLIIGLFFPPIGIVIGPLVGAFLGELIGGQSSDRALKSAWGSFLGFLAGTLIKVVVALILTYYFIVTL